MRDFLLTKKLTKSIKEFVEFRGLDDRPRDNSEVATVQLGDEVGILLVLDNALGGMRVRLQQNNSGSGSSP